MSDTTALTFTTFLNDTAEKLEKATEEQVTEMLENDTGGIVGAILKYLQISDTLETTTGQNYQMNTLTLFLYAVERKNVKVVNWCVKHLKCTDEMFNIFGYCLDSFSRDQVEEILETLTKVPNSKKWWVSANEHCQEHLDLVDDYCPHDHDSIEDYNDSSLSSESTDDETDEDI